MKRTVLFFGVVAASILLGYKATPIKANESSSETINDSGLIQGSVEDNESSKEKGSKKGTRSVLEGTWGTVHWSYDETTAILTLDPGVAGESSSTPWIDNEVIGRNVKKIALSGTVYLEGDCTNLFFEGISNDRLSVVEEIDVEHFDVSKVTGMHGMFYNRSLIGKNFDISNWDTSNVTEMSEMFAFTKLTTLDLSNWDTSNVTTIRSMFQSSRNLTTLDVSNWDTSKMSDIAHAFSGTSSLPMLDVSNWDTSRVTKMSMTFANTPQLEMLDVSNWDTSSVTTMYGMFIGTGISTPLDVSTWNTTNVNDMSYMFESARALPTLDVSNWNTAKVTNMASMFNRASSLTTLDVNNWDTTNVKRMASMFNQTSLEKLNLASFDFSSIESQYYISNMLAEMAKLKEITVGSSFENRDKIGDWLALPAIPATIEYSGRWIGISESNMDKTYSSEALMNTYTSDTVGTYILEKNKETLSVKDSTITVGDSWKPVDNFVFATDLFGGTITIDQIEVSGDVDTSVPGEYSVVYKNNGLNQIVATANITVLPKGEATLVIQFVNEIGDPLSDSITLNRTIDDSVDLTRESTVTDVIETLVQESYTIIARPNNETAITLSESQTTVSYVFMGSLFLQSAPTEIDFGSVKYQGKTTRINSAEYHGVDLIVKDNRANKNGWSLTAKLITSMTSTDPDSPSYTLEGALKYVYKSNEITLTRDAQDIMIQPVNSSKEEALYNISDTWSDSGDGFKFEASAQDVKTLGTYHGEILWELGDTP